MIKLSCRASPPPSIRPMRRSEAHRRRHRRPHRRGAVSGISCSKEWAPAKRGLAEERLPTSKGQEREGICKERGHQQREKTSARERVSAERVSTERVSTEGDGCVRLG